MANKLSIRIVCQCGMTQNLESLKQSNRVLDYE